MRRELDAAVLAWTRERHWSRDDERFDELALALFAHQFTHCEPYRRFCEGRDRTPADVASWREIPAVPTGAFKELALRTFSEGETVHVFRTSGTSSGRRGEHHLDTLELYEGSLLPTFCRFLLPDLRPEQPEATILVLAPSPGEARDSSLSHMFAVAIREAGSEASRFCIDSGRVDMGALRRGIDSAPPELPLLVCGAAFAFVHLLDALGSRGESLELPANARVMETGGFKGRSRSVPRGELYAGIEAGLGVPLERIVNQYGMTELSSQFYDSVLREPDAPRRKLGPPWARVRILDPDSGAEVDEGTIFVTDLANTGSSVSIQTADVGRRVADGFEVVGREPGAEQRGCSIAADELLARSEA